MQPIFGQPNPKFYSSIDIQNWAGGNPIAWVALNVMGRPAITLGNTIHVGGSYYRDDYSAGGVSIGSQALIAHETTHVFQNQQNGIIGTAAGSVIDNATKGDNVYYYALSPGVGQAGPPKPFSLYGVEQQAAMVQDYYSLTHGAPSQLNVSPVSSDSGALPSYQATLGTAGLAMPAITGGDGAAAGGFLIYPNKPNNNSVASVYRK